MKIITVLLASAALASAVRVNHQKHAHRHADMHRRAADVIEYVPGPEVIVYELDGKVISAADVEKGLADGSYVLITQAGVAQLAVSTSTVKSSSTYSPAAFYKVTTSSSTSVAPTHHANIDLCCSNNKQQHEYLARLIYKTVFHLLIFDLDDGGIGLVVGYLLSILRV